MTEYSDVMRVHLARYKEERLGVMEQGMSRSQQRQYPHILPESLFRLNILEDIRREFWTYYEANRERLVLHTDFHHLNSSQAFAFNLLFPWFEMGVPPAQFLEALGFNDCEVVRCRFEHMPDEEERTVVDFYVEFRDERRLMIEVKLTEANFGQVVPKEAHQIKRRDTYLPLLASMAEPAGLEKDSFFLNYQLFRNVSKLDLSRGDIFLVIAPRANAFTWSQATAFQSTMLMEHARNAVRLVAVEDLLNNLAHNAALLAPWQATHVAMLAEKYLPGIPA
jgi:hypothetical protein